MRILFSLIVLVIALPGNSLFGQKLQVRTLPISANDLVYSASLERIVSVTPAEADTLPSSIVLFDPITAKIDTAIFVDNDPDVLALTEDGNSVYIGFEEINEVIKFDLLALETTLTIDLGGDIEDDFRAQDIQIQPGNPDVIAVSLEELARFSSRHEGVVIFDQGIARPNILPTSPESEFLQFGSNPSRLYGYSQHGTANYFSRIVVNEQGLALESFDHDLIEGFRMRISFADDKIYTSVGHVIDPEAGQLLGQFIQDTRSDRVVDFITDSILKRTFFLWRAEDDNTAIIVAFDNETFACLAMQKLEGVRLNSRQQNAQFIRWGETGLAFNNDLDDVVIVESLLTNPLLPVLHFASSELFFDAVSGVAEKAITLTNTGTETLFVDSTLTSNAAYSFTPSSFSLVAGASMEGRVQFSPTTFGLTTGHLQFFSNAASSPDLLDIQGTANVKSILLESRLLDFGEVAPNQSTSRSIEISNNGAEPIEIRSIRSNNLQFAVQDSSLVLLGSDTFPLLVSFIPAFSLEETGYIIVESDAITSFDSLAVQASLLVQGQLSLDTRNIALGEVPIATEVDTLLHIVNTGLDTLRVSNVSTSNEVFSPLISSFDVFPGARTNLGIRFSATNAGSNWAALLIESNAPSSPDTVFIAAQVVSAISTASADNPTEFSLGQNFPNPISSSTTIPFELPHAGTVALYVYDALGREKLSVLNEHLPAGQHEVSIDVSSLSNGTYVYRIEADNRQLSNVMVVLKGK